MIRIYTNDNNKVNMLEVNAENFTISSNIIWIDLYNPSDKQRRNIEEKLDITLPTREEMGKIEVINPFYQEDNVKYMTITVPDQSDTEYFNSSALTFVLNSGILITLRYVRLPCWTNFNHLVEIEMKKRGVIQCTGEIFLMILLDLLVNYAADILEVTGNNLDILLKKVFIRDGNIKSVKSTSSNYYNDIMSDIGRSGNIISKIRESFVSINRMLIYFSQMEELAAKDQRSRFKHISREIHSLSEYASFLSQRNSFLLDATLGMISVEQNMIIKVFTVAAAVFMPPTLIASIYGMNFHFIPELEWHMGYPFALLVIVISALLPYAFFKRKGWL